MIQKTESKNISIDTETWRFGEIAQCGNSFEYFLRHYVITKNTQERMGLQPMPDWDYIYSTARDFDNYNQILILKSRQLMISWLLAARLIHVCMFNEGEELLCVSRGGLYSREVGLRSEVIYNNLPEWMQFSIKTHKQFGEYEFPETGSKYLCLAADEDVGRTFSPSGIFFDEVAFFPYGSKVMSSLAPLLEGSVSFIGVSTPNGKDPLFHPMWHAKGDKVHRIKLHYSQRPKRDKEWVEEARKRPGMTPQKWAREQEHSFATPAGKPVYEIWNALQVQKCFSLYNPHKPLLDGFDRGHDDPAWLVAQVNDDDQLMILHSEKGDHIARKIWLKHVEDKRKSLFPNHKAGWISYGAADFTKPESEGDSWRKVMEDYGIYLKDSQRDDIDRRLEATRTKMLLRQDGKFGIIVDPDHCDDSGIEETTQRCQFLLDGLSGGYCYPDKPDYQGHLKPLKNEFSHEADCLAHICDNHFDVTGKNKRQFKRRVFPKREYNPVTGRPLN